MTIEFESDAWFCGHICMAARKLGIYLSEEKNGDKSSFMFGDMNGGRFISGRQKETRQESLKDACNELVQYLNGKL